MRLAVVALALLLTACNLSHEVPDGGIGADAWVAPMEDAGLDASLVDAWVPLDGGQPDAPIEVDAFVPLDAPSVDAGPAWVALGCATVTYCIPQPHLVPVCFASGDRDPAECRRWLSCADCYACREWSSHPFRREPPEAAYPDQPECEGDVCPVVDAGGLPGCGDAGPS